ncbi:MAG: DUF3618 domain-containing protein [Actinomycetota bacterium]
MSERTIRSVPVDPPDRGPAGAEVPRVTPVQAGPAARGTPAVPAPADAARRAADGAPVASPVGSPAAIEAEIERTRAQLAATIDELAERVRPANLARRGLTTVRGLVVEPDGRPRTGRLLAVGGALAAVVALAAWRRVGR